VDFYIERNFNSAFWWNLPVQNQNVTIGKENVTNEVDFVIQLTDFCNELAYLISIRLAFLWFRYFSFSDSMIKRPQMISTVLKIITLINTGEALLRLRNKEIAMLFFQVFYP